MRPKNSESLLAHGIDPVAPPDQIALFDLAGHHTLQERLMKNFTFIAAAALAIGLGFGFTAPANARITKCDNPKMSECLAECQQLGGPDCYRFCCLG